MEKDIKIKDIIAYMIDGNPGAMVCLIKLMEDSPDTWLEYVKILEKFEIYGSKIYMLWNDCCKQEIKKFKETIKAFQEGRFTKEEILQNLSQGYAIPFEELEELKQQREERKKYLSMAEYKELIAIADRLDKVKMKYILRTLVETGIRSSDLRNITVEAVEKGSVEEQGKVRRTVFINKKLQKELLKYCNEYNIKNGSIFFSSSNEEMVKSYIRKELEEIAKLTDISPKKLGLYSFRILFLENNLKNRR